MRQYFLAHCISLSLTKLQDLIPATSLFNVHFRDLLYRLLAYDPEQRPIAKQTLEHPWFQETTSDDGTNSGRGEGNTMDRR